MRLPSSGGGSEALCSGGNSNTVTPLRVKPFGVEFAESAMARFILLVGANRSVGWSCRIGWSARREAGRFEEGQRLGTTDLATSFTGPCGKPWPNQFTSTACYLLRCRVARIVRRREGAVRTTTVPYRVCPKGM